MNASAFAVAPDFAAKLVEGVLLGIVKLALSWLPMLLSILFPPTVPIAVTGIVLFVVAIVFIAELFGRTHRSNGLSSGTNRAIGSTTYSVVHLALIYISWRIWGIGMFDDSIFWMLQMSAFMTVRIVLLETGVWVY